MKNVVSIVGSPVGELSKKSEQLMQWVAEVDTYGANPNQDEIYALLATCPDPSCVEALELEQLLS